MTDSSDLHVPMDDRNHAHFDGRRGLDNILGGGLDPNRMYLYEGSRARARPPLRCNFCSKGSVMASACYRDLSETQAELELVAKRHGWSLEGIDVFPSYDPGSQPRPRAGRRCIRRKWS